MARSGKGGLKSLPVGEHGTNWKSRFLLKVELHSAPHYFTTLSKDGPTGSWVH